MKRGLTVAFAADTHLHADFLSGAIQLAATSGTRVLASAAGDREFAHTGLRDGDEVDLGGLRLRALHDTRAHPRTSRRFCCSTATARSGCSPAVH